MRAKAREHLHRWWGPIVGGGLAWFATLVGPSNPALALLILGIAAVWTVFAAATLPAVQSLRSVPRWAARACIAGTTGLTFWAIAFRLLAPPPTQAVLTKEDVAGVFDEAKGELADEFVRRLPKPSPAGTPVTALSTAPPAPGAPLSTSASSTPPPPEICLRLVYPREIALLIVNCGTAVLREPKVLTILIDIDQDPDISSGGMAVLPIPTLALNDWIRPGEGMGPYSMADLPGAKEILRDGHRVVGTVKVACPDCRINRTYWVYWIAGEGGWYSEIPDGKGLSMSELGHAMISMKKDPEHFFADIPRARRMEIGRDP